MQGWGIVGERGREVAPMPPLKGSATFCSPNCASSCRSDLSPLLAPLTSTKRLVRDAPYIYAQADMNGTSRLETHALRYASACAVERRGEISFRQPYNSGH